MNIGELLRVEVSSVRANILPMLILWGLAGAVVGAYYLLPGAAGALRGFADFQVEYGKLASFANRFVCGGVIPSAFLLAMPSIRPPRPVATALAQSVWCGLMGIAVDAFFALQGAWFGTEPSLRPAVAKALVDQFGFCVLFVTPLNAVFYVWLGNGLAFRRAGAGLARGWFARSYAANIVVNWAITIPTMVAVYAFPMELQITVSGLVGAAQALLFIFMGRKV